MQKKLPVPNPFLYQWCPQFVQFFSDAFPKIWYNILHKRKHILTPFRLPPMVTMINVQELDLALSMLFILSPTLSSTANILASTNITHRANDKRRGTVNTKNATVFTGCISYETWIFLLLFLLNIRFIQQVWKFLSYS